MRCIVFSCLVTSICNRKVWFCKIALSKIYFMKHHFLCLVALASLFSCKKNDLPKTSTASGVTKAISFTVRPGADYTGSSYTNVTASVELVISSADINGLNTQVLYDTIIESKPISQFNQPPFPLNYSKIISNVIDNKNLIRASYNIHYERKYGNSVSPSNYNSGIPINSGNQYSFFDVVL